MRTGAAALKFQLKITLTPVKPRFFKYDMVLGSLAMIWLCFVRTSQLHYMSAIRNLLHEL